MAGEPGIVPKAALTTSRLIYRPFQIPQKLNQSATLVGEQGAMTVGAINGAVGTAFMKLEPRGPLKNLGKIFLKVDQAVQRDRQIAKRNKDVFWDPFANGVEQVGRAFAGPGAYYYAKKAGHPEPSNPDVIKGLLEMKLFQYPSIGGGGGQQGGGDPAAEAAAAAAAQQAAAEQAAAQAAAQQAAEGAGQAQAA